MLTGTFVISNPGTADITVSDVVDRVFATVGGNTSLVTITEFTSSLMVGEVIRPAEARTFAYLVVVAPIDTSNLLNEATVLFLELLPLTAQDDLTIEVLQETVTSTIPETLPQTGFETEGLAASALVLLGLGALLWAVTRCLGKDDEA